MHQDDATIHQLNRIKGQIEGIIRMYNDGCECVGLVRQTIAASNSLRTVAKKLLTGEAQRCSRERRIEDLDEILHEVFKY